jgi:fucose permease
MKEPSTNNNQVYFAIAGVSALLCFALLLTSSFWLTMAIMLLGGLHLARHFPDAEVFIAADPLLVWLRRVSPLIILGIFGAVLAINWFK